MMPKISVLMSVYNGENYLKQSIESILNQTFNDFEFIIVNDGSTDSSDEILKKYANFDSRIKIHSQSNAGLTNALNFSSKFINGDWIARIDSDDISLLTRLEKQYEYVSNNPGISFLGSGMISINPNGETISTYNFPTSHSKLVGNLLLNKPFPPHASALISRNHFKKVNGYRSRIKKSQDWDLWLRLSEVGLLACIDEPLVKIRTHDNQISNLARNPDQITYNKIAVSSHILRLNKAQDPVNSDEEHFKYFYNFVSDHLKSINYVDQLLFKKELLAILNEAHYSFHLKFLHLFKLSIMNIKKIFLILKYKLMGERIAFNIAYSWKAHEKN